MSWWDSQNFTHFASNALKNAQKKIDQVLDIKEEGHAPSSKDTKDSKKVSSNESSWTTWLSFDGSSEEKPVTARSSWALPFDFNNEPEPGSFFTEKQSSPITEQMIPKSHSLYPITTMAGKDEGKVKTEPSGKEPSPEKKTAIIKPDDQSIETRVTLSEDDSEVVLEDVRTLKEKSSDVFVDKTNSSPPVSASQDSTLESENEADRTLKDPEISSIIKQQTKVSEDQGQFLEVSSLDTSKETTLPKESLPLNIVSSDCTENYSGFPVTELSIDAQIPDVLAESPCFTQPSGSLLAIYVPEESDPVQNQNPCLNDETSNIETTETEKSVELLEESEQIEDNHHMELVLSSTEKSPSCENVSVLNFPDSSMNESTVVIETTSPSNEILLPCDNALSSLDVTCESLDSFNTVIQSHAQVNEENSTKADASEEKPDYCDKKEEFMSVQLQSEVVESCFSGETPNNNLKIECEKDIVGNAHFLTASVYKSPPSSQAQDDSNLLSTIVEVYEEGSGKLETQNDNKLDSSAETSGSGETVVEKDVSPTDSESKIELETGAAESVMSSSSNSSYVKCLIEEAMEETRSDHSDSHSNSADRSESSKTESEHNSEKSISGHDSGDEIDTTTSSDIEIISTPTPNGERGEHLFDLSPLRLTLHKSLRRHSPVHSHYRSDSQSSSSTYSKCGESDQLSPRRDSLERQDLESGDESKEVTSTITKEHSENYEQIKSNENTVSEKDPCHPDKLLKKLAEMSEILQHRENKLVQLSRENNDLLESNSILRNQLLQCEETRESEMADVNALTQEFTIRIGEAEKKLQTVLKEKESLKVQLQQTLEENSQNQNLDATYKVTVKEKDEQITELLQEGEKLSKQQLQCNNIIKKLRVKEKESDSLISTQKKKLEEQKNELERLKVVLDSKEEMEKKQTEAIAKLNAAVLKQDRDIIKMKSDLEDAQEKARGLQVALDNSYKEIAELNKSNAARDSKVHEAVLSAEMQARDEYHLNMEKERLKSRLEKESLIMQIEDLRMSLTRMEKEYGRREDLLKREIADLQQRSQEDEARNQDLTNNVTSATRPLLRQIENLQSTFAAQSALWEKREKGLMDKITEINNQLAVATEKDHIATEKVQDQSAKLKALETQISSIRQEKSQLTAMLEMEKSKSEMLEDSFNNAAAQLEAVKQQMSNEIQELKKEKVYLETQLEIEKTKVDTEKKKLIQSLEQMKEMEKSFYSRGSPSPISSHRGSPGIPTDNLTLRSSPLSISALSQDDLLEKSLLIAAVASTSNGNKSSLYESLRQGGAASLLESLQSQLKQKEGEINQLQEDISQLEKTRESMARELVNLSNLNEDLQEQVKELPEIKEKHSDLYQRYNALLQMYGEKVEEAEEMRMDLQDIKKMYKDQIDHLLAK